MVALRKESVDRNLPMYSIRQTLLTSLSARRAWIEIQRRRYDHARPIVALRKESVDRNTNGKQLVHETTASLSARRAWIEISHR